MRLRQLGHGQSVKFFAPEDVHRRIEGTKKSEIRVSSEPLGSFDVLKWVITETCADLLHKTPHWLKQGTDYMNRRCAWDSFNSNSHQSVKTSELQRYWLQKEARTLPEMYVSAALQRADGADPTHPEADMSAISERVRGLGLTITSLPESRVEEEQEREVEIEVEREVQIERPPKTEPAAHSLHDDILRMVREGAIPSKSNALVCAFDAISKAIASPCEKSAWTDDILATLDFMTTVVGKNTERTSLSLSAQ